MATGLGIAAGAFADNYARAMGLRSQLDDAEARRGLMKTQQEAANLQLEQQKALVESQKAIADDYKNFLDPNFDYVGGKPMEPQAGIAAPGTAPVKMDPFKDSARVGALYDRQATLLERQAALAGKNPLEVRAQFDKLRKDQFVERVGGALSLIEAGDEAGIKQLQGVYDLYPDGRKITGGKINQDGSVLLQYEQNGQAGERVISKDQLLQFSKLALNPADAAKLRFQLIEKQKDRDFEGSQLDKRLTFTAGENEKDRNLKGSEGDKDRANRVTTATIGGEASVAAASIRGAGGGETTDARQRLKMAIDGIEKIYQADYDAVKANTQASFSPEKRTALNKEIQRRQALAEEIIRGSFQTGNENVSGRSAAVLADDILSGQLKRSDVQGYLTIDGKEDRSWLRMRDGTIVPASTMRFFQNDSPKKTGVTPPGGSAAAPAAAVNPRTGRPMVVDGPINPRTGLPM